jgi:hypothetical protein
MNPFTRSILKRLQNRRLQPFVEHWDRLEALVIRVYKSRAAGPQDEAEYRQVRSWLLVHYPTWQTVLEPYWRSAPIGGEPASQDPFTDLLSNPAASGFIENWKAMQTLPAARQALNEFIVAQIQG